MSVPALIAQHHFKTPQLQALVSAHTSSLMLLGPGRDPEPCLPGVQQRGRCFAMKLGVQPDRVLQSMLNDRMVAKGLILQYATAFFQDYLSSETIDDLVALLRKARLDTHLLDLFPPRSVPSGTLTSTSRCAAACACLLQRPRHSAADYCTAWGTSARSPQAMLISSREVGI